MRPQSACFWFVFAYCLFSCAFALAKNYPDRDSGDSEIIYLENEKMEVAIRNLLVSEARYSVDVLTIMQSADETGMGFIQSLRKAQQRGVTVRHMSEPMWSVPDDGGFFSIAGYRKDWSRILRDASLQKPGQVIAHGALSKWLHGIPPTDTLHEKVIIIDRGTPYEKILVTTRPFSKFANKVVDSSYIIRPVDPEPDPQTGKLKKEYLGTDFADVFDQHWKFFEKRLGVGPPQALSKGAVGRLEGKTYYPLKNEADHRQFYDLVSLLHRPARAGDALAPYQFRPAHAKLFNNDLFQLVEKTGVGSSIEARSQLPNDNFKRLIELIDQAVSVDLTNFAFIPLPELRQALERLLQRGGKLRLITNGLDSHAEIGLDGAAYYVNAEGILELAKNAGPKAAENLSVYELSLKRAQKIPENALIYGHSKRGVIVLQDGRTIYLGGSENFNLSTRKCSELMFEVEDQRMTDYMSALTERELNTLYDPVPLETIAKNYADRPCRIRLLYPVTKKIVKILY